MAKGAGTALIANQNHRRRARRKSPPLSAAHRANIAAGMRNKYSDPDFRYAVAKHLRGLSAASVGIPLSQSHREKIGNALKGRPRPPKVRDSISRGKQRDEATVRNGRLRVMHERGLVTDHDMRMEGRYRYVVGITSNPHSIAIKKEERRIIANSIKMLPKLEQQVINGIYFEGKTINDLAHQLKKSADEINSAHTTALATLRANKKLQSLVEI